MTVRAPGVIAALLVGCAAEPEPAAWPSTVTVPGEPAPHRSVPLSGGAADDDERWLVAADVDGDRLVVFDVAGGRTAEVRFPAGWAPVRVAVDGRAAVILAGAGAVALVEPETLRVEVVPVCAEPRGVDVIDGRAWVACGDGQLLEVGGVGALQLGDALGDLVLDEDGAAAWVAVPRRAEVLRVALATGEVEGRWTLPAPATPDGRRWAARALRRLVPVGDGRIAALYQAHALDPMALEVPGAPVYGTGACDAVARPLVAWIGADGPEATVRIDTVLPLDLALWDQGDGFAAEPTPVVAAALAGPAGPGLQLAYPPSALAEPEVVCVSRSVWLGTTSPVVGVGVLGADQVYGVTRGPFGIETADGPLVPPASHAEPDLGLALFHAPAPAGVACATCHVDGRDDAHTWVFDGLGPRRTQPLAVPIDAPFHWDGVLVDLPHLLFDTGEVRMGLPPAEPAEVEALGRWLEMLPRPVGAPPSAASERGEAVFASAGCAACHVPPTYGSAVGADVGTGGVFQVPSLVGVGARLPVMHTGCAETLAERFDPACGGDAHGPALSEAEIADLVAFLGTL